MRPTEEKGRALICGISGQDGAYLAQLFLKKGYEVAGTSRDAQVNPFSNLCRLGLRDQVRLESASPIDFRSILQVLRKVQPHEVYNLAGQSSVGLSFEQPVETFESIVTGTVNLLEAIRFMAAPIKLYNACSGECFGITGAGPADEHTPFRPRSPYAVAKAAAFWAVANYREAYGLFACSGILFNHESPLRQERFVTRKIVAAACRIAQGSQEKLHLGNISIQRDWGWAPEYVQAMHLMLQQDFPDDYVVATGVSHTLAEFAAAAFSGVGLDWQEHVVVDERLMRPTDISMSKGLPAKVKERCGWQAQAKMEEVVQMMLQAQLTDDERDASFSARNRASR